jgi:parvulin-like peptidyl-prolyl isomerase
LEQYGSWASIAGVVISVVGFAITIFNVAKSKSAAVAAKNAARDAQSALKDIDAISEISMAIERLEGAKSQVSQNQGLFLAESFSRVRRRLISAKDSNENLTPDSVEILRTSIRRTRSLENKIHKHVEEKTRLDILKTNKALSIIMDDLHKLQISLKNERSKHGS